MTVGELELEEPVRIDASKVMAILQRDHQRLGAVLERVEHELGARRDLQALCADAASHGRLLGMLAFLHEYADRIHHPLETRLFDRLIEKGLTPSERRVVFVTMSQHEEILGDLLGLQEELRRLQGQAPRELAAALRTRAERYLDAQKRHLHFEDSQLLPLIFARLTARDWCEMERDLAAQIGIIAESCEREFLPAFRAILEAA